MKKLSDNTITINFSYPINFDIMYFHNTSNYYRLIFYKLIVFGIDKGS